MGVDDVGRQVVFIGVLESTVLSLLAPLESPTATHVHEVVLPLYRQHRCNYKELSVHLQVYLACLGLGSW